MGRPDSSARSTSAARATSLTAATSEHRSLVIRRATGVGIRQVHDRSIASPRQVHYPLRRIQSLTGDTGNPCCMTPRLAAASRSGHSAARHGAVLVFHPGGSDAHPVTLSLWSLDEIARADPAARPGRGYEQGQPATWCEQDGEEPADRNARHKPVRRAVRRPGNGTKRARIGKASGYTHRSFRPDAVHHMYATTATHRPTVTHADTWRDKNKTARLAAFPQRAPEGA